MYLQFLLFSDLDEEDHIKLLSSSQDELEDALAYIRQLVFVMLLYTLARLPHKWPHSVLEQNSEWETVIVLYIYDETFSFNNSIMMNELLLNLINAKKFALIIICKLLQRNDWRLRYNGVRAEEELIEQYELLKKAMFIKVCGVFQQTLHFIILLTLWN